MQFTIFRDEREEGGRVWQAFLPHVTVKTGLRLLRSQMRYDTRLDAAGRYSCAAAIVELIQESELND